MNSQFCKKNWGRVVSTYFVSFVLAFSMIPSMAFANNITDGSTNDEIVETTDTNNEQELNLSNDEENKNEIEVDNEDPMKQYKEDSENYPEIYNNYTPEDSPSDFTDEELEELDRMYEEAHDFLKYDDENDTYVYDINGEVVNGATQEEANEFLESQPMPMVTNNGYAAVYGGQWLVFSSSALGGSYTYAGTTKSRSALYSNPFTQWYDSSSVPWKGYASSITTIIVNNTVYPISIDQWFMNFTKLTTFVNVSYFNLRDCQIIGDLFRNCTSLKNIDLSSWNTSNNVALRGMFRGCSNLETVNITGWNTSKVGEFGFMFAETTKLQQIYGIENIDTRNGFDFANMFCDGCAVPTANVNDFRWLNLINATNVTWCFTGYAGEGKIDCTGIGNVGSKVSCWANGLFSGASNIEEYYNTQNMKLTYCNPIDAMFNLNTNLKKIDTSAFNINRADAQSLFDKCENLESDLDLSNCIFGSKNSCCMFNTCKKVKSIKTTIDLTNQESLHCMFSQCISLENPDITFIGTANNLTNLRGFCNSIYNVNLIWNKIKNIQMPNIDNMSLAFSDEYDGSKYKIIEMDLSNITSTKNINWEKCFWKRNVEIINLPKTLSLPSNCDSTFAECSSLYKITIPPQWKMLNTDSYLPTPDAEIISAIDSEFNDWGYDVDGNWYIKHTGTAYTPAAVATYTNNHYSTAANAESTVWYAYTDHAMHKAILDYQEEPNKFRVQMFTEDIINPNPRIETDPTAYVEWYICGNKDGEDWKLFGKTYNTNEDGIMMIPFEKVANDAVNYLNKYDHYFIFVKVFGPSGDIEVGKLVGEMDATINITAPISYQAGIYHEDGTVDINRTPFYSQIATQYAEEDVDSVEFTYYSEFKPNDKQVEYNGESMSALQILDEYGCVINNTTKARYTDKCAQRINFDATAAVLQDTLGDFWFQNGDLVEEIGSVLYHVEDLKPLKFIEAQQI